jgi:hypothetical protein
VTRQERIQKLAKAIQREIVSCPNEQSFDEGDTIWISGCPTDVPDLLMQFEVPEDMEEEVVAMLHCPQCGSPLEPWQDVGTKYDFESAHEFTIDRALRKYGEALHNFNGFLHKLPMQGATHPFGKTIVRELRQAPRTILQNAEWYRARASKEHGFGPTPAEYVSDQRYNSSGQARWYFADNAECAVTEVAPGGTAWIQQFEIPHLENILDLRAWRPDDPRVLDEQGDYHPPHGLLVVALIYGDLLTQRYFTGTQLQDDEKRKWKPEYLVPRFVAEAAEMAAFKGILCRSVRFPGDNLIVFDTNWTPKSVGTPRMVTLDAAALRLLDNYFLNQGEGLVLPDLPDVPHDLGPSN